MAKYFVNIYIIYTQDNSSKVTEEGFTLCRAHANALEGMKFLHICLKCVSLLSDNGFTNPLAAYDWVTPGMALSAGFLPFVILIGVFFNVPA